MENKGVTQLLDDLKVLSLENKSKENNFQMTEKKSIGSVFFQLTKICNDNKTSSICKHTEEAVIKVLFI